MSDFLQVKKVDITIVGLRRISAVRSQPLVLAHGMLEVPAGHCVFDTRLELQLDAHTNLDRISLVGRQLFGPRHLVLEQLSKQPHGKLEQEPCQRHTYKGTSEDESVQCTPMQTLEEEVEEEEDTALHTPLPMLPLLSRRSSENSYKSEASNNKKKRECWLWHPSPDLAKELVAQDSAIEQQNLELDEQTLASITTKELVMEWCQWTGLDFDVDLDVSKIFLQGVNGKCVCVEIGSCTDPTEILEDDLLDVRAGIEKARLAQGVRSTSVVTKPAKGKVWLEDLIEIKDNLNPNPDPNPNSLLQFHPVY